MQLLTITCSHTLGSIDSTLALVTWCNPLFTYEWRRTWITKIHANLVFQVCILLLRCFRKGTLRKHWQPSRFTCVYLVFEVFRQKWTSLSLPFLIKMPLLICYDVLDAIHVHPCWPRELHEPSLSGMDQGLLRKDLSNLSYPNNNLGQFCQNRHRA